MDYHFTITGVITEIEETKVISPYFKKRDFFLRYSDDDYLSNKRAERTIKLTALNDGTFMLDGARKDDLVDIDFYIDGKDVTKDNKRFNFTSLVAFRINILSSPTRNKPSDKDAVITKTGRDYDLPSKESTDDELAGIEDKDPLLSLWDKKKAERDVPEIPKKDVGQLIESNVEVDDLPF